MTQVPLDFSASRARVTSRRAPDLNYHLGILMATKYVQPMQSKEEMVIGCWTSGDTRKGLLGYSRTLEMAMPMKGQPRHRWIRIVEECWDEVAKGCDVGSSKHQHGGATDERMVMFQ